MKTSVCAKSSDGRVSRTVASDTILPPLKESPRFSPNLRPTEKDTTEVNRIATKTEGSAILMKIFAMQCNAKGEMKVKM